MINTRIQSKDRANVHSLGYKSGPIHPSTPRGIIRPQPHTRTHNRKDCETETESIAGRNERFIICMHSASVTYVCSVDM